MIRNAIYFTLLFSLLLGGCGARKNTAEQAPPADEATQKAIAFQKEGNFEESLTWYAKALDKKETPELRNGAGAALLSSGSPDAALKEFERALTFLPSSPDLYANKGTALSLLKKDDAALDAFDKALTYKPDHAEALNGKAIIELRRNNFESAMVLLIKARKSNPNNKMIAYNTAIAFESAGLLEDAEAAFTDYLKKYPNDALALNCRGVARLKLEKYALANKDLSKAIKLSSTTGSYYYNRGLLWQKQLQYKKAIIDYTRSIAYSPENSTTYVNRGDTYFLLDEKEKGCSDLIKACHMGLCDKLESYKKINLCTE